MKLIKFEKENCAACNSVETYLKSKAVEVEKINPFESPSQAVAYKVMSVPVTILLDDEGNEVKRTIGFKPNELDEIIGLL